MANGFLISGWLLRVLDANGAPPGSAFPFQVAFFDASTQTPATVYNDVECAIALGPVVALDAEGYAPDGGVWGEVGKSYKAVVSRVLSSDPELSDSERLEVLYTLNGIGEAKEESTPEGSGVSVSGMAALRLIVPGADGSLYFLSGYYSANDGGQGWFRWNSASHETDDGGYSVRPDAVSTGEAGRFVRVMGGELDVRWWGAIPDGSVDCLAPLLRCRDHAGRVDLYSAPPRIAFHAGTSSYSFSGNVVLGGSDGRGNPMAYRIAQGARFGGTGTVTLEGPCSVESTSVLHSGNPVRVLPSAVREADLRWWLGNGETDAVTLVCNVSEIYAPGIPLVLDLSPLGGSLAIDFSVTISARLIMVPGSVLSVADGKTVALDGGFEVRGERRRVFSRSTTGVFKFPPAPLDAWVFGWGSSASPDSGLSFAASCAAVSGASLVVNGYGVDGFSAPSLESAVGSASVPVRIDGALAVGTGTLSCACLENSPGARVVSSSGVAPLLVSGGAVHASWFGAGTFLSVRQALNALPGRGVVDLDGFHYDRSDDVSAYVDADGVTVRNGRVHFASGSSPGIVVTGEDFAMVDVRVGTSGTFASYAVWVDTPLADAQARHRYGFRFLRCVFDLSGAMGVGICLGGNRADYVTGDVVVDACRFAQGNAASKPLLIPQTSGANGVAVRDCLFSLAYSNDYVLYGANVRFCGNRIFSPYALAVEIRWKGSYGFRFESNDCAMVGVTLDAFSGVEVSRNSFQNGGSVLLNCQYNGQTFEHVLVEDNRFPGNESTRAMTVKVVQSYTVDANGRATAVKAFSWSPSTLRLRIRGNAPGGLVGTVAQPHQTEVYWTSGALAQGVAYIPYLIPFSRVVDIQLSLRQRTGASNWVNFVTPTIADTYAVADLIAYPDIAQIKVSTSAGCFSGIIRCSNY